MLSIKKGIVIFCLLPLISLKGQTITTIAGNGSLTNTGDGGPASASAVYIPSGGVFDKNGNYFFCVSVGAKVRKLSPAGIISTVAGNGTSGFSGDGGLATNAKLNMPGNLSVDSLGNLFITDGVNNRIRKVDITTGMISTFAGSSTTGFVGDGGAASAALLNNPVGTCFDKFGNFYIADCQNFRVRKINTTGTISTFAGVGSLGTGGMGGPATSAQIQPIGLCSDQYGNVYITDNTPGQTRVCKVNLAGIITIVAGDPVSNLFNGDEIPATNAHISAMSVDIDVCGNLFIADGNNNRIRKIDNSGIIHTVAGNGGSGFSGDGGSAVAAQLHWPYSAVIDSSGNLYITDSYNYRVRKVTYSVPPCDYLGVEEHSTKKEISIYPNPTNDELHITSPGLPTSAIAQCRLGEVVLCNMLGQVVLSEQLNSKQTTLNIKHLPPGLYLLALTGEDGKRTVHKIVKE